VALPASAEAASERPPLSIDISAEANPLHANAAVD